MSDLHFFLNPAAILWTIGGLVGIILRLWLRISFRADLVRGSRRHVSLAALAVGQRTVETNSVHLFLKVCIVCAGIAGSLMPSPTASGYPPNPFAATILLVLLAVPWVLNWDAIRELQLRRRLTRLPAR